LGNVGCDLSQQDGIRGPHSLSVNERMIPDWANHVPITASHRQGTASHAEATRLHYITQSSEHPKKLLREPPSLTSTLIAAPSAAQRLEHGYLISNHGGIG